MAASNQDRQTVAWERIAAAVERFVDAQLNPNAKKIKDEHLDDYNLMTRAAQAQYDYDPRNYALEREAADAQAVKDKEAHERGLRETEEAKRKAETEEQERQQQVQPAPEFVEPSPVVEPAPVDEAEAQPNWRKKKRWNPTDGEPHQE